MPASLTDKITDVRNSDRPNSTTASGSRAIGGDTLACASLTGWPTASKVHFVTYQTDTNNDVIAGTQLDCYGIVAGNTITNFTILDGTDGGNSVGDKVEMLPTAGWAQDLAEGLMVSHNRDGSLADGAVDSADVLAVNVVTTPKILDSNVTLAKMADSSVGTAELVALGVTTPKMKPTYYRSATNHNGTASRQTSSSNFNVTGSTISYTTGDTAEMILLWGSALINGSGGAGAGLGIRSAIDTVISRRTYNSHGSTHETSFVQCIFEAAANTSYTFGLFVYVNGSTEICNATTDASPNFHPSLEMIAWGRS